MDPTEAELIAAARNGNPASFEPLVAKYQGRVFATARRYARRESEVEDIVQEVFIKAFQKLDGFRGEAPFEHWLMRLAVRTCYDFLRSHKRNRETAFTELSEPESDWLDRFVVAPDSASEDADAARQLIDKVLSRLSPRLPRAGDHAAGDKRKVREGNRANYGLVGDAGQGAGVSRPRGNEKDFDQNDQRQIHVTRRRPKPSELLVPGVNENKLQASN